MRSSLVTAWLLSCAVALAAPLADLVTPSQAGAAFAPGTLAWHLSTNAAAHAAGISDVSGGTFVVSHWNYATYSGPDMAQLTNAVWSSRFWLEGVSGLSATSIGSSNGLGAQGLISMVSPRHYLFATHMHPEGFMVTFLGINNVIYWRKTLQRADIGRDISVGILDAELPPSVGYLPVLPADYTNYLPADGTSIVQGLGMNQDNRMFGEPMTFGSGGFVGWNSAHASPFGVSTNWNMRLRGGDSSNPALLLIGHQLVLVSHNTSVGGGPDYALQFDAINQKLHYLSTNNSVDTDYQLTRFPLTNWPAIH